jgi:hypothetical protein
MTVVSCSGDDGYREGETATDAGGDDVAKTMKSGLMHSESFDSTSCCRNATVMPRDVGMTGNGDADECDEAHVCCSDESDGHAVVHDVDVVGSEGLLLFPNNPVRMRSPLQRLLLERAEYGVGQTCSPAGQAIDEEPILACPAVVGVDELDCNDLYLYSMIVKEARLLQE